jgi:molybdopterin converting factor subunit 1
MKITIRLFAAARDAAGSDRIEVSLPDGATVRQLRSALVERAPGLQRMASSLLVAIGNDYATDEAHVDAAAEVAVFPPVSGG